MNKDYIHIVIKKFFENDLPGDIRVKFGEWLTDRRLSEKKEEAMMELWENEVETADGQTYEDLAQLHRRIGFPESGSGKRQRSLLFLRYAAAILLLPLIGAWGSYLYLSSETHQQEELALTECFVPNGERRQITLPDGSSVWLNANSLLVYESGFKGDKRLIYLNGEANFEVMPNPDKPFLVKTAHLTVEALGTTFCVNAYPDQKMTIATLEKGKIRVNTIGTKDTAVILSPNEQLTFHHQAAQLSLTKVDAKRILQWADGYLVFQGASFEQIAKAIERKYNVTMNYETELFAGRSFTMRFNPGENLRQVLDVMKEMIKNFHYKIVEDKVYIY